MQLYRLVTNQQANGTGTCGKRTVRGMAIMEIILDNDATVVDYRRFIDKFAIPYFKKKYNMNVAYEDKLELEDIFDCKNMLIRREYSEEDAEKQVNNILDKFWISPRYILYSVPWMFFPKAAKTLRILKKQGHHIEIHTSKMKASESNLIGRITRFLMYLSDGKKIKGII